MTNTVTEYANTVAGMIARLQGMGFTVYRRGENDTYMFYSDGTRIGYIQRERFGGWSVSTVHVPNRHTGTGISWHKDLDWPTDAQILDGFRSELPSYCRVADAKATRKYRDVNEWLNRDSWNRGYRVEPTA